MLITYYSCSGTLASSKVPQGLVEFQSSPPRTKAEADATEKWSD